MMWIAIFTFMLLTGYFIYGKSLEKNWEIDIYRDQSSWQEDESVINHFGFRYVQLAQFALFLSFETLISAVYGYVYGLAYVSWLIIGSVFFGGVLSYYGGMYALRNHGYTLNYAVKQKFGTFAHAISTILLLALIAALLSDSFKSFSLVYEGIFALPQDMLLLYCLGAAVLCCFCSARQLAIIFAGIAIMALVTLGFLFFGSSLQLDMIEYGAQNFEISELKYAYPVAFFVITVGSVSCLQGLQASLIAPMVKNEKVGRKVFFGATIFQAFFLIICNALVAAWNPEIREFYSSLLNSDTPYTYLQNIAFGAGGKKATLLLFAFAITLFLGFVGSAARLARNLISETKIGQYKFLPAITALAAVILPVYWLNQYSLSFSYVVVATQLAGLFSCYILMSYLKENEKKYFHVLLAGTFVSGALLSYVLLILCKLPLYVGNTLGLSLPIILIVTRILHKHQDYLKAKWAIVKEKMAERREINRRKKEEQRLKKEEQKRIKQEEAARKKLEKAEVKKQKEEEKAARLAAASVKDEDTREQELEREISRLQSERSKIDRRVKEIEKELEKEQSKRLLFETSADTVKQVAKEEEKKEKAQTPDLTELDKLDEEVSDVEKLDLDTLIDDDIKIEPVAEKEEADNPEADLKKFDFDADFIDDFEFEKDEEATEKQPAPTQAKSEAPAQNKKKRHRNRKNKNRNGNNQAN